MVVDTDGTMQMRGESGAFVPVRVVATSERLKILSGDEVVGDWDVGDIGIQSIPGGFAIRAEGEEFVLRPDDAVGIAEELEMTAVTPRLARRVAVSHNPEPRPLPPEPDFEETERRSWSHVVAIVFALGGVLVLLGGTLLRTAPAGIASPGTARTSVAGVEFWLAFVIGGLLMVAVAYVISLGSATARIAALLVVGAIVLLFGYAVSVINGGSSFFTAYGFIAGGVIVGVAVLFSGTLHDTD
jgi:VIT1/CCC1 family predicted Fe2+/Mn2+ transporter